MNGKRVSGQEVSVRVVMPSRRFMNSARFEIQFGSRQEILPPLRPSL